MTVPEGLSRDLPDVLSLPLSGESDDHCVAVGDIVSSLRTSLTPFVCCATRCAVVETSGDGTVPVSVTTPAAV